MENVISEKRDLELLGSKLKELKTLFSIGEKIVPGIQKLVDFIHEMSPLLVHINSSIAESNAKIPKATDHITDVTNATEMATTEILDLTDTISANTSEISNVLNSVVQNELESKNILSELAELVSDNPKGVELVKQLSEKMFLNELKQKADKFLENIQMDSTNIAIALQVQDITTQQLSAVNHLIVSVQKRLASLMFELSEDQITQVDSSHDIIVPTDTNFDMNASYIKQQSSQIEVDEIIKSSTSQDEIDKLFG
ncbi:MAG: protein phosphatase CheZ [Bacteroidetes bacterium]|nr:protein phosphatase CheZ [Bacteroidota bacterium]MBU1115163.1 protein phosphatase CheZ [Bacteroidota bacterium]MBU1799334.1 protein phosphatase CheZ [Bacteroidota bacterium]